MPQYKVELLSVDREDDEKDIQFFTYVEAFDSDEAIAKAKIVQRKERPGVNAADTWSWFTIELPEK